MKLVIISHTAHYFDHTHTPMGWGPTVREVDQIATLFDSVIHVAPVLAGKPPTSVLPYTNQKVKYVSIKAAGGKHMLDKVGVITTLFYNLKIINRCLSGADWVHLRLPTNIGLYVLPYLLFKPRLKKWFKYAGDWNRKMMPVTYAIQRWWINSNLLQARVTINGKWSGQQSHLLSFENPCLTVQDCNKALIRSREKNFSDRLVICFVGMLSHGKGIVRLLKALQQIANPDQIEKLIIVGDGPQRTEIDSLLKSSKVPVELKGFMSPTQIHQVYSSSHMIMLPSDSEGFPKVIAEGAAFGCVPVVTDVSAISQYVFHEINGWLLKSNTIPDLVLAIESLLERRYELKSFSEQAVKIAHRFTYERYLQRIETEILG